MENARLQRLALLAEVVSAAVVVISIAFLVVETRNNTKAINVQTHFALTGQLNQWREQLTDMEYIAAREKSGAEGIIALSEIERSKYLMPQLSLWSIYESAFFAYTNGALDRNGWERFGANICLNYESAVSRGSWVDSRLTAGGVSGVLTADFRDYIQATCAENP